MREVSSSDADIKSLDRGLWALRQALAGIGFEPH
jgi:hypothetical protein